MADDYIKVLFTNDSGVQEGYKILTNLTINVKFLKGIDTTDILYYQK